METVVGEDALPETTTKDAKAWWRSQPSSAFLRDPYFYFKYDLVWLMLFGSVIAAAHAFAWEGLQLTWTSWLAIPLLLVACYVQVLSGVCVHNCTHGNFPSSINRLVGEVLGVIIGTRYASWEILHRRHHQFSDSESKDPHPANPGFWRFFFTKMLGNLENNIRQQHQERYGESAHWLRVDRMRTVFSFLVGLAMLGFWHALLGTVGFFYVYLPSLVFGAIHVSHFNWATHRGWAADGDYRPVNLNHGPYKLGNWLCFGLYFHANHHAYVKYFNPGKLPADRAEKVDRRITAMRRRSEL